MLECEIGVLLIVWVGCIVNVIEVGVCILECVCILLCDVVDLCIVVNDDVMVGELCFGVGINVLIGMLLDILVCMVEKFLCI